MDALKPAMPQAKSLEEKLARLQIELPEAKAESSRTFQNYSQAEQSIEPLRLEWRAAYQRAEKIEQQIKAIEELLEQKEGQ